LRRNDALLGKTKSKDDPHHQRVFEFSVGPWRWAELIWPNVSGRWFPINARWIEVVPAEGRVWTPSLYLGVLPFWLALGAVRYRRQLPIEGRWLVWCTLLSVLGSMGAYGAGWLIVDWITYRDSVASASPVGQNFGNLYWLMTVLLPWYVKFRYPAKLWTLATFGLSVLAGLEWDRRQMVGGRSRWLVLLGLASVLGVAATFVTQTQLQQFWTSAQLSDSIFGPLHVEMAWADVIRAFSQSALLCLVTATLFGFRRVRSSSWGALLLILLITIDLVLAHHWMLPTASITELETPPTLAEEAKGNGPPIRIYRSPSKGWRPDSWQTTSSPDRMTALVKRDRQTLYPQHHLSTGQAVLNASATIPNRDWQALIELGRKIGPPGVDGVPRNLPRPLLEALDVKHHVSEPTNVDGDGSFSTTQLAHDSRRVWAVDIVGSHAPLITPTREQLLERTHKVWFQQDLVRDTARSASIESNSLPPVSVTGQRREEYEPVKAVCNVTQYAPNRVVVEASVSKPALLVLNEQYHPDWQAEISFEGSPLQCVPLFKTNCVMRGVYLEKAGDYEVHYTFRSRTFEIGAAISGSMWMLILLGWVIGRVRK